MAQIIYSAPKSIEGNTLKKTLWDKLLWAETRYKINDILIYWFTEWFIFLEKLDHSGITYL